MFQKISNVLSSTCHVLSSSAARGPLNSAVIIRRTDLILWILLLPVVLAATAGSFMSISLILTSERQMVVAMQSHSVEEYHDVRPRGVSSCSTHHFPSDNRSRLQGN
jgi:hypothetical protein